MRSFYFDQMIPQLLFVTGGESNSIINRIQVSSQNASFTEIFLSGVHVDNDVYSVLKQILGTSEWNGLHMAQCDGLIPELIVTASTQVEKMSILGDSNTANASWCRSLSQGLKLPNSKLKKLMLRVKLSMDLSEAIYQATLSENCNIEELIVPISDSCENSLLLLSRAFKQSTSLKTLKLNRHDLVWQMDKCQVVTLMKSLQDHKTLKELSIQGSSCSESGIRAISECVVRGLDRLDLSNHRFGGDRLYGVKYLSKSLLQPNNLSHLSLSGHCLSGEDMSYLGDALSNEAYSKIQELQLNNCHLGDASITIFAKFLPKMKQLKFIYLHDNPFDRAGSFALLEGLNHNWNVEQMVMRRRGDPKLEECHRNIEFHLALNRAGRKLLRTKNQIPLSLWPKVLHRVRDKLTGNCFSSPQSEYCADAIFHLLQGPALLQR